MAVIALDTGARYRLLLYTGVQVDARYVGQGVFLAGNKSYGFNDIKEIIQRLPE